MTPEEATHGAILTLLDVVEELCLGLAAGQTPESGWASVVSETFAEHRNELRDPEGHSA